MIRTKVTIQMDLHDDAWPDAATVAEIKKSARRAANDQFSKLKELALRECRVNIHLLSVGPTTIEDREVA